MAAHDSSLFLIIGFKYTLHVAVFSIWTPVRLFGIISQILVRSFLIQADNEKGKRAWIRLPSLPQLDVARHLVWWFLALWW